MNAAIFIAVFDLIGLIILGLTVCLVRRLCRGGWTIADSEAVSSAVTCTLCEAHRQGHGRCICTVNCGHPSCTYSHTALTREMP